MATADHPGSGPVSLFAVSNKLQSKVNAFREVVEGKKLEVRRVSKEMRSLIERKEEAMIRELDAIWQGVNERMTEKKSETQKKIQEFEKKAKEMLKLFEELSPNSGPLFDIHEKINSLRTEMDIDIPSVKVTLRVNELEENINRMFRCEHQILAYKEDTRYQLKWSKCESGKGDNQLYDPCGISTNPENGNIYIADQWNNRIQIFSGEGEWIKSVKHIEMKSPYNVLLHNKSIYVQCDRTIMELNESTEKKEKSKLYDFSLGGICTDNAHIYVGKYIGMNLIVLTLDLIEVSRISFKNIRCKQDTNIKYISLSQESFYVLLSGTEYTIQVFSREGILIRCVVQKESIHSAYCFCLDQQHNILVADRGDSKVKIFSNEGKLLTQFGEKGYQIGQFIYLIGISVDELGSIFTVDNKESHKLQAFSLL